MGRGVHSVGALLLVQLERTLKRRFSHANFDVLTAVFVETRAFGMLS
jgi:hypothetical protein